MFRLTFLLTELPAQFIGKNFGPDRWIPLCIMSWGVAAACQFFLNGRASFLALRAVIGVLQGSFIPDMILYLSYYYKSSELPLRLAILWTADRAKNVLAPLLAAGLLRLRGTHGYAGWRYLLLVEGLFSFVVGVWAFIVMVPSPTQTKAWFRPNGWFNEGEEKVLVNRILRDDPSKGGMHNRQPLSLRMIWDSLKDYDLWPIYAIGLTFSIPTSPPGQYLTLSLKELGFSAFNTSMLSIPPYALTSISVSEILIHHWTNA